MYKIHSYLGKPMSIDLSDLPVNPTNVDVEPVMQAVSNALNRQLGAVKVSGYWLIGTVPWSPIFGHLPGQQTRKFDKALANVTGLAVIRTVKP